MAVGTATIGKTHTHKCTLHNKDSIALANQQSASTIVTQNWLNSRPHCCASPINNSISRSLDLRLFGAGLCRWIGSLCENKHSLNLSLWLVGGIHLISGATVANNVALDRSITMTMTGDPSATVAVAVAAAKPTSIANHVDPAIVGNGEATKEAEVVTRATAAPSTANQSGQKDQNHANAQPSTNGNDATHQGTVATTTTTNSNNNNSDTTMSIAAASNADAVKAAAAAAAAAFVAAATPVLGAPSIVADKAGVEAAVEAAAAVAADGDGNINVDASVVQAASAAAEASSSSQANASNDVAGAIDAVPVMKDAHVNMAMNADMTTNMPIVQGGRPQNVTNADSTAVPINSSPPTAVAQSATQHAYQQPGHVQLNNKGSDAMQLDPTQNYQPFQQHHVQQQGEGHILNQYQQAQSQPPPQLQYQQQQQQQQSQFHENGLHPVQGAEEFVGTVVHPADADVDAEAVALATMQEAAVIMMAPPPPINGAPTTVVPATPVTATPIATVVVAEATPVVAATAVQDNAQTTQPMPTVIANAATSTLALSSIPDTNGNANLGVGVNAVHNTNANGIPPTMLDMPNQPQQFQNVDLSTNAGAFGTPIKGNKRPHPGANQHAPTNMDGNATASVATPVTVHATNVQQPVVTTTTTPRKRQRRPPTRVPWEVRMAELAKYKQEHGNLLIPIRYKLNPSLGKFVHNTREQYKLYHHLSPVGYQKSCSLTPDRVAQLETMGFVWSTQRGKHQEQEWQTRFQQLQQYKKDNGHCLVPHGYPPDPSFAEWVHRQRTTYIHWKKRRDKQKIAEEQLQQPSEGQHAQQEQQDATDATDVTQPGAEQTPISGQQQQQQTAEQTQPQTPTQQAPNAVQEQPQTSSPTSPLLPTKVNAARRKQRRESEDRIAHRMQQLQDLGFKFQVHSDKWMDHWHRLKAYRDANGDCLVPTHYAQDNKLGRWVHTQRHQRRLWKKGGKSSMTQHREDMLNELNFAWDVRNPLDRPRKTWLQYYDELTSCDSFVVCPKENPLLHAWVYEQKYRLKWISQHGDTAAMTSTKEQMMNRMSADRIRKLAEVGFTKEAIIHPQSPAKPQQRNASTSNE